MKPVIYLAAFGTLILFSCRKNETTVTPASTNQEPDYVSGQYHGGSEIIGIDINVDRPNPEKRDTIYNDTDVAVITRRDDSITFRINFLSPLVNNVTMKYADSNHYRFSGYGSHFYEEVDIHIYPPADSLIVRYHTYHGGAGGSAESYYTFWGKK